MTRRNDELTNVGKAQYLRVVLLSAVDVKCVECCVDLDGSTSAGLEVSVMYDIEDGLLWKLKVKRRDLRDGSCEGVLALVEVWKKTVVGLMWSGRGGVKM